MNKIIDKISTDEEYCMNNHEIIEKLKDIISQEMPDSIVYEKDVAKALGNVQRVLQPF